LRHELDHVLVVEEEQGGQLVGAADVVVALDDAALDQ
jgi:hypothetical protein